MLQKTNVAPFMFVESNLAVHQFHSALNYDCKMTETNAQSCNKAWQKKLFL